MVKIVILGSCRFEPYEILFVPNKLDKELYEKDHDEAYRRAFKVYCSKIHEADIIIVYAPDGIGEHTEQDLVYTRNANKTIMRLVDEKELFALLDKVKEMAGQQ